MWNELRRHKRRSRMMADETGLVHNGKILESGGGEERTARG